MQHRCQALITLYILKDVIFDILMIGHRYQSKDLRNAIIDVQVNDDANKRCYCRIHNGCPHHQTWCDVEMMISSANKEGEELLDTSKYGCEQPWSWHRIELVRKRDVAPLMSPVFCWVNHYVGGCFSVWSIKGIQNNGRGADDPFCCICRRNVRVDSCPAANKPISWLNVRDETMESSKADLTPYLSSRTLEAPGRWFPTWRSVGSSRIHWFRICMAVVQIPTDGCSNIVERYTVLTICYYPI